MNPYSFNLISSFLLLVCFNTQTLFASNDSQNLASPAQPIPYTENNSPNSVPTQQFEKVSNPIEIDDTSKKINPTSSHWEKAKQDANQAWSETKEMSNKAWQSSQQGGKEIWKSTQKTSKDVWQETSDGSKKAWTETKKASSNAWKATKTNSKDVWSQTKKYSNKAWGSTKSVIHDGADYISDKTKE